MKPEDVIEHFQDPAAVRHYSDAARRIGLWLSEEHVFRKLFLPDDSILEVGCGTGRISLGMWEIGYGKLLGVDFSKAMISEARRLAKLLDYGISFRVEDAARLSFDDELFDGVIFGFNGLMQNPARTRRRRILSELRRVVRSDAMFVFTTHDRELRRYETFWEEEKKRWENGEQDPLLEEFGDRFFRASEGATFMHIPTRQEVLEDLAAAGWEHESDHLRSELANEPAEVREFSEECRFWIARKPGPA